MTRRLHLPDTGAPVGPDARRHAPSAERNAGPILAVVARHAPPQGSALELASGTGQHIVQLAPAHPGLTWQPTDADPANLASISAWAAAHPAPNLAPPAVLDAAREGWSADWGGRALILCVNLLHLIPDTAAATVLAEAGAALAPGGRLMVYGPFLRDGQATSAGDAAFHASLRAQDPAIGYKDLAWVLDRMTASGLRHLVTEEMPANNLMLVAARL